jgi:hypothetical protein
LTKSFYRPSQANDYAEQFKGSKGYYKTNRYTDISELVEILKSEETEQVNQDATYDSKAMILPETIISDSELERIMDRSPEAFEKGVGASDRFKILDETCDETNDALVNME